VNLTREESSAASASGASERRPSECIVMHTRILRCMLAVDDCYAYWQKVDLGLPVADRARVAFERRWFGLKSEARVRTIMTDMIERFDAYPEALALLHRLGTIPASLRPLICHVHTQLADPIYRRFSGEFLPSRRAQGYATIDRETVARWIASLEPGRWSTTTCMKYGANLLSTAMDAGLVSGRRDPRKPTLPAVPDAIVGYVLYLLRGISFEGTLSENPYLRSLGVTDDGFASVVARVPGIRFAGLGNVGEVSWLEPGLMAWGLGVLGAGS
jgi:hypothetical protein